MTGILTLPLILLIAYLEKRDTARGVIGRLPMEVQRDVDEEAVGDATLNKAVVEADTTVHSREV